MTRNRVYVDTTQRSTVLLAADVFQLHDPPKSCKHVACNKRGHVSTVETARRFYAYFSGEEHELLDREYRDFHDYTATCGGEQHQQEWLGERGACGMIWGNRDWDYWRPGSFPSPNVIFVFRNDNGRHFIQKTNLVAESIPDIINQLSLSADVCNERAHFCESLGAYGVWKEVQREFNHVFLEFHNQPLSVFASKELAYYRMDNDLQDHLVNEQSGEKRCCAIGNQFFAKLDTDGTKWGYVVSEEKRGRSPQLLSKDIPLKQWAEDGELTTKLFELRIQALELPDKNNGRYL